MTSSVLSTGGAVEEDSILFSTFIQRVTNPPFSSQRVVPNSCLRIHVNPSYVETTFDGHPVSWCALNIKLDLVGSLTELISENHSKSPQKSQKTNKSITIRI